ncbi:surfeit locus 1 family protein [Pseudoalteromonas sp. MBR-15]|jgi:cytochrome oxidase assembly protein ShyY1
MQLILRRKQKLSSIIAICVVSLAVLVCLRLSVWQYQRGEQKQQQLSQLEQSEQQGVMDWQTFQLLPNQVDKTGLKLTLNGLINTQRYWLLDNQIYQGQVGYDLLAAVKINDDIAPVIVNFGWLKAPIDRSQLPTVNWPQPSHISTTVQLKQGQLQGFTLADEIGAEAGWPKRIQAIDLDIFSRQLAQPLQPFLAYRLAADDIATPHYESVVMGPDKHYAYAVQWLLIGAACVVIAYFAMRRRRNES